MAEKRVNDALQCYLSELSSRVVDETSIPSDRYHLGKIILRCLRDFPDTVLQIDGATGESDTNASMLEKSVKCASCFRSLGLVPGDVIVLMAPNHIALSIPFYAALFTGVIIAVVDKMLEDRELQDTFSINKPKIIFCQSEKAPDIQVALNEVNHTATIITFDKGDYLCDLTEFMEKHADEIPVEEFEATEFDAEKSTAVLISTSGTTGLPKAAELTHKNFLIAAPLFWSRYTTFPRPVAMSLVGSPLQWLTAIVNFITSPILNITRLQSSIPITQEFAYYLINTYKPDFTVLSPTFMASLINEDVEKKCDFSCFDTILLGGSAVPLKLIEDIRNVSPNTDVLNVYGMSELGGIALCGDMAYPASCGHRLNCYQYRIVDINTDGEICDPYVQGELWVKGPSIFKGYYKNIAATEAAFTDGEWLRTGDMFYRDEKWNFYFVERIKLLLKYKSNHISPLEIENVIRQHHGVQDVAVTGIEDPEGGDLPVACVLIKEGHKVTAEEIKQLVKDTLTDTKQLRGGVIFLNSIPLTATTKVHRRMLKEMAKNLERL